MLKEFKTFVLRGNVVELAVGVVMGVAFNAVIQAIVANLITPLVAAIFGKPDFSALKFSINGSAFRYGIVLNSLFAFLSTAAAIFFFVVKPLNHLMSRARKEESPDPTTKKCPECLSEISADARRCAYCTTKLDAAA
jgi:large conductance mechanosensitive channel